MNDLNKREPFVSLSKNEPKVRCIDCGMVYSYNSEDIFPFHINSEEKVTIITGICRKCSTNKIQESLKKIC